MTDRDFWRRYWSDYEPARVERVLFGELLERVLPASGSFIEIGGFPGVFCVEAQRRGLDSTLLDFYIDPPVVRELERVNELPSGAIQLIEADFLSYRPSRRYDVVFSAGFIEHFENTREVLACHVELLADGGLLFVTVPNFRGLNGLVQRCFDAANFRAHNTAAMRPELLQETAEALGLGSVRVLYHGRPQLWLEQTAPAGRLARSLVHRGSRLIERLERRNRLLSPHLVLTARLGRDGG